MGGGCVPQVVEEGRKLIKTGEDKPEGEIKSFRPVTLLPVMGKLAERVIAGWLQDEISDKLNPGQYGFRRGVGTKEALERLGESVQEMGKRYVCGVFADVKGAFD